MKNLFLAVGLAGCLSSSLNAQVYISEIMANAPGTDPTREYFELRGTPNLSLAGYYLIGLEGEGTTANPGTKGGRGDINQFFDLGSTSIGANGYLIALQSSSVYTPTVSGATVFQNTGGAEWGSTTTSTVGHNGDNASTTVALENSATTILLVNIGTGAAPLVTDDLDLDNDGVLDTLPEGWTLLDSVGLLDGVGATADNVSYGAITFRVGLLGGDTSTNVIQLPGTGTSLYVGRKGESTGSTPDDWFGAIPVGNGPNSTLQNSTDPFYDGKTLAEMQFGGVNPVPEPSTWALLGLGIAALGFPKVRRRASQKS